MIFNANDSFFLKYNKPLSLQHTENEFAYPFHQHPQFQQIVDVLCRKDKHHLLLQLNFSDKFSTLFLEAFINFIKHANIPHSLKYGEFLHLDLQYYLNEETEIQIIVDAFKYLHQALNHRDNYMVIAISNAGWLINQTATDSYNFICNQFNSLMGHHNCRIILLSDDNKSIVSTHPIYQVLEIQPLDKITRLRILNKYRLELEEHHHVYIPEELLPVAQQFAKQYLPQHDQLHQTILLLDSSAARASIIDNSQHIKPSLNLTTIERVIIDWTKIPNLFLQTNKVNINVIIHSLQQIIFGQDAALSELVSEWQQTKCKLHNKHPQITSFLLIGAPHVGKTTTAMAFAESVVGKESVYQINATTLATTNLADIPCSQLTTSKTSPLKNVILTKPFAIYIINNIEIFSPQTLQTLTDFLTSGRLMDANTGEYIYCKESLFIFTTEVGGKGISDIVSRNTQDTVQENTMMQLIMRDTKKETFMQMLSNETILNSIKIDLTEKLPICFLNATTSIPFIPLTSKAISNILRSQLTNFKQNLFNEYQVELDYASEIIKYFSNEIVLANVQDASGIETIVMEISQAVSHSLTQYKPQHSRLFLQLNETGAALQAIWQEDSAALGLVERLV